MTLEERIAKGTEAYILAAGYGSVLDIPRANRILARKNVEIVARSMFPELFTDPPTGWIAPWTMPAEVVIDSDEWVQMRDEYLHHYPMKPTEATKE